jgi:hypothetical protein
MTVYGRYGHIFWIPMFPIGKTGISVCNNCSQVLKLDAMQPQLRLAYDNLKSHAKIPVWHFSGLGIIALIIIGVNISEGQRADRVTKLVHDLKTNDIIEVKLKEDQYTLFNILKADRDSVFFIASQYQSTEESGLSDLKNKEFAIDSVYTVPKQNLVEMDKKGEIVDIDRK